MQITSLGKTQNTLFIGTESANWQTSWSFFFSVVRDLGMDQKVYLARVLVFYFVSYPVYNSFLQVFGKRGLSFTGASTLCAVTVFQTHNAVS